ncbi:class I SAM-dependent methyltransferase [Thermoflavimicrobium daqui]|uniref:class I SAM-dependent methyltransferase n=1 Tax=Thermoflavimicrobium daqui TaxID=2137476 RepID=UPI00143DB985|nr:methyltransferase domain-containing protein [Thermoflavimicrobium daqui]
MSNNHLDKIVKKFDAIATEYQQGQARRLKEDMILRLADPKPNDYVLDVATGTGAVLLTLATKVKVLVGLDVTSTMLERAVDSFKSSEARPLFITGNAEQIPVANEMFDLVTCSRALHHMEQPELAISEMFRVLKSGGRLMILDNTTYENDEFAEKHNRLETMRDSSHHRTLPISELVERLQGVGFTVSSVLHDEVLRSLTAWFADAGTDPKMEEQILKEIKSGQQSGDPFYLQHFQEKADGEWTFRYQMVWLVAHKTSC